VTSKAPKQDLPVTTNMLSETGTSSIRVLSCSYGAEGTPAGFQSSAPRTFRKLPQVLYFSHG